MEIVQYLSSTLSISSKQVEATLRLLEEGATVPFIARYKKEETGNLSDVTLRSFVEEKEKFEKLEERKKTVLSSIEEQGKLTSELKERVETCTNLSLLETIYRPYKPKRKTRGSIAKERGLEPLANYLLKQQGNLSSLKEYASSFISKDVATIDDALQGAMDILAENISDNPDFYLFACYHIL